MWIIPTDVAMEKLPLAIITRIESSDYGGCHKFIPNYPRGQLALAVS